ncbi:conjugal transfer protein TraM [Salmonella enterica subsp. enterica serovar Javiana]|nr:conjugal transfer protein TraM [Salmonella enterica subsp. enterica serovar Javiana]EBV2938504.1 conjugal transfer protein TraM [Salmonella enterica subsp. enterica serovar Javiana]EEE6990688.1 conjugal transfer protein TraM [Salmonella enterica subsp. enterica serovar Javiana]
MPRHHVYMKQKTLDGIRRLVDERKNEGAGTSEANISSVAAELLEVGLRVTEQIRKKEKEQENNDGITDEERYQHRLLEECIKSRLASQEVLRLIFSIPEIKDDTRNDFSRLKDSLKQDVIKIMEMTLPEKNN